MADINSYARNGVAGLSLVLKLESGKTLCRGLVTLEHIFQLNAESGETVKKTCLMYPRNIGKVILGLSLVQKREEPEIFNKERLFVAILKLQMRNCTESPSFKLKMDDRTQVAAAVPRKPYEMEFNSYSSKLVVQVCAGNAQLHAEVCLEGCITNDDLTVELPVVDDR